MNMISVITVNYNNDNGLKKTIESVINQTYKNFEFIIIDGGSTDQSSEIIKNYQDKINYWVSEPDKGVYSAMNKGIKVANGDFLIFMNSGDVFINENVLQNVVPKFDTNSYFIYGNNFKSKGDSKRLKTYPKELSFSFFYGSSLNHQATFINKKAFIDLFLYDENKKIVADWELFIVGICKENLSYQYINETICNYDFTGMSSTGKYKEVTEKERQEVMNKYFPLFAKDYEKLSLLNSKRFIQILHIQNHPVAWKFFKWTISLFLLFTSKMKK